MKLQKLVMKPCKLDLTGRMRPLLWSSTEGNVRVVIFLHQSEDEAKCAFEKFNAGVKANVHLPYVDNARINAAREAANRS
ncbi:MAG: hypothetical protein DMF68_20750 [Acidobacteria bacterium]|nr:MAG: hypothetical protein DMF68_20750 [Acidobacteriota bacterium]